MNFAPMARAILWVYEYSGTGSQNRIPETFIHGPRPRRREAFSATRTCDQSSNGLASLSGLLLEPWGSNGDRPRAFPHASARASHTGGALPQGMGNSSS